MDQFYVDKAYSDMFAYAIFRRVPDKEEPAGFSPELICECRTEYAEQICNMLNGKPQS